MILIPCCVMQQGFFILIVNCHPEVRGMKNKSGTGFPLSFIQQRMLTGSKQISEYTIEVGCFCCEG